jgi:hypothetical protein
VFENLPLRAPAFCRKTIHGQTQDSEYSPDYRHEPS